MIFLECDSVPLLLAKARSGGASKRDGLLNGQDDSFAVPLWSPLAGGRAVFTSAQSINIGFSGC